MNTTMVHCLLHLNRRPTLLHLPSNPYHCANRRRLLLRPAVTTSDFAAKPSSPLFPHNSDGPTLDLSLEPDVPHTDEDPDSTPRGQSIRPKRTRSSIKTYKEPEVLETGNGTSSEPKSQEEKLSILDSSWLPDGWTVQVKTKRTGQKYKVA
ncbi:hypothetical protein L2E82_18199 [Cichorium intybus]|uniref:Uncharacterized protein n=1 Tax=Cichorium intybus TaxID=13427 RepID=A0ACB9F9H7_CICIN|nr:hypothetical protein L2E82_18199 [Cichorium intybus]